MGGQRHAPAALPPGKTRYPFNRRRDGPQGRAGRVRKISPPTGIRSTDRPARSESLYPLSYPDPLPEGKEQKYFRTAVQIPDSVRCDYQVRTGICCLQACQPCGNVLWWRERNCGETVCLKTLPSVQEFDFLQCPTGKWRASFSVGGRWY